MPIAPLLRALTERAIAQNVTIRFDESRMRFPIRCNTVGSIDHFYDLIGNFVNHIYSECIAPGGRLSPADARGFGKDLLEREFKRRRGNIVTAYNDAHDGTNGGVRHLLDVITDALKAEAVERYVTECFDENVQKNSFEQQVEIIEAFIAQCGPHLRSEMQSCQPERYARNYEELIRAYVEALKSTSSVFRRL